MARFGFCGPSYTSESPNVAASRCVNWYPETTESDATTPVAMYPTPGIRPFASLTGTKVRGMYEFNGRLFVVTDKFNEVFPDGTFTAYSFLPDDGLPVTMEANSNNQLLICAAGQVWFFPLVAPASFNISTIQVISGTIHSPISRLLVTFTSSVTLPSNSTLYFAGLTTATQLNGTSVQNNGPFTGTTYAFTQGTWHTSGISVPYGPAADTGTLSTAANVQVTTGILGSVSSIEFLDGYFIALLADSARFQISALEDALTWDPINVFQISVFADNVTSMIVNQRQLFFLGRKRSIVYYDSGDALVPFQPIPGAFIEQGISAQWSVERMDNSIFWISQDERGYGIAYRMNGYTPVRVSNFAVENIWRQYRVISDAISYAYVQNGHSFWVIYFGTADATWVYDAATGQWHERTWLDNGVAHAHRSRCHALMSNEPIFPYVLVGDNLSGTVYILDKDQTQDVTKDAIGVIAHPIQRIRSAPHISNEQEWTYHQKLQVYLESGLGVFSSGAAPQINLQWSNDGGHTWSNEYAVSAGALGEYSVRCIWRRLGRARDRIYRIICTDNVRWRIVDSYLEAVPGFTATPRLVDSLKKGA